MEFNYEFDLQDEDAEITAYHEAGHAVMAIYLGGEVHSVSIAPDRDDAEHRFGDLQVLWMQDQKLNNELLMKSALVALAGPVAEMIHRGESWHPGLVPEWSQDWRTAWQCLEQMLPGDLQRLRFLERATVDAFRFLQQSAAWNAVAVLVDELLAHERLDADEVKSVLRPWGIGD